jgi:hypothetical protein
MIAARLVHAIATGAKQRRKLLYGAKTATIRRKFYFLFSTRTRR